MSEEAAVFADEIEEQNDWLCFARVFGSPDGQRVLELINERLWVQPDPSVDNDAQAWSHLGMSDLHKYILTQIHKGQALQRSPNVQIS